MRQTNYKVRQSERTHLNRSGARRTWVLLPRPWIE